MYGQTSDDNWTLSAIGFMQRHSTSQIPLDRQGFRYYLSHRASPVPNPRHRKFRDRFGTRQADNVELDHRGTRHPLSQAHHSEAWRTARSLLHFALYGRRQTNRGSTGMGV